MAGNDVLEGGGGADVLDGGEGSDTAAYTMSEEGVTINLSYVGTARPEATGGDATGDEFEPKTIENVRGSMEDDKLTGDGEANKLYGKMGDDMLMGGDGDDTIRGGKDDDEIDGGDGDDMIQGDMGDDMLTGGDGEDTFILMEGDGDDEITDFEQGEDTIQLGPSTEKLSAADIRDVLDSEDDNRNGTYTYDWEDVSITVDLPLTSDDFGVKATSNRLTEGNDDWTGTSRGDVVHGLGGDDTLAGGDGDDSLFGNAGNDRLMGEDDDDDLSGGRDDDNLMGGSGRDMLYGGPGDDTLSGNRGNDMLTGGSGADTFWFGPRDGYDTITDFQEGDTISLGGAALPMAEIDGVLATVGVNDDGDYIYDWMDTRIVVNRPLTEDDFEMGDRPVDPDGPDVPDVPDVPVDGMMPEMAPEPPAGITPLGPGDVTFPTGTDDNSRDDKIVGGEGDDSISGGLGRDSLWGGEGDDDLNGEAGDDQLVGGEGDDSLDGGMGHDTLWGGDDKDTLVGGDNDDVLYGGDDDDSLMGDIGDDTLWGGEGDDVLNGGGGNDMLHADKDDEVDGGSETDTLSLEGETEGFSDPVSLNSSTVPTATAHAPVTNVEKFIGSEGVDTVVTDSNDPVKIEGRGGNDMLTGGGGNDTIDGGAGADMLTGGGGNDTIDGGAGADMLTGGAGNDTFIWGNGDTIKDFLTDGADDKIDLDGGVAAADLMIALVTGKTDAVTVTIGSGSMTLEGLTEQQATDLIDAAALTDPTAELAALADYFIFG